MGGDNKRGEDEKGDQAKPLRWRLMVAGPLIVLAAAILSGDGGEAVAAALPLVLLYVGLGYVVYRWVRSVWEESSGWGFDLILALLGGLAVGGVVQVAIYPQVPGPGFALGGIALTLAVACALRKRWRSEV